MSGAANLVEINFDGIVGPSHNYAGLSLGNLASASHKGDPSYPARGRAAGRGQDARQYGARAGAGFSAAARPARID